MKLKLKNSALALRKKGYSFSQIKQTVSVSKSTLSLWLADFPLSKDQMVLLRDRNPKRIESFRNTMRVKRESRFSDAFMKASKDISKLSNREFFLCGLFLYWAEGYKTARSITALTNTDPDMIKFFIKWLSLLGVDKKKLKIKLHIYADMNKAEIVNFWCKKLRMPRENFTQVYVKQSNQLGLTYRNGFSYGTCTVIFGNQPFSDYVLAGLKYIRTEICGAI